MRRQPTFFVSIPVGVPLKVAARSKELRAIGILYTLKAIHSGGLIRNYYANGATIAATFGFGKSKLLENIKLLRQLGFAEKVGKHLRLTSSKAVALHYGCCPDTMGPSWVPRFHRLPIERLDQIELELKGLALKESLTKQEYAVAKKEANKYLLNHTPIPSDLMPAARKRLMRGYDPVKARYESTSSFEHTLVASDQLPAINPVFTLSRQGLARLLGRRSARTGTRWANKLSAANLITDTISRLRVRAISFAEFQAGRAIGFYGGAFTFFKGFLWQRLSNVLAYTGW